MALERVVKFAMLVVGISLPLARADSNDLETMQRRMEEMDQELSVMRAQVAQQAEQIAQQEQQIRIYNAQARQSAISAAEVDEVVRQTIADADRRSQLLAADGQLNAGYNNGFFISSGDAFTLRIRGLLMTRYTYNHQRESLSGDDERSGFEMARTRFGFFGNVIDPSWQFVLWTGYSNDASVVLLDTFVKKTFDGGLSITAGQYKMPFWREWLISETRLPLAERSLLNRFGGGNVQGVMFGYEKNAIHAYLSASDGLNTGNTGALVEDTEGLALTGRVEWLVDGLWPQYVDTEAWPGDEPMLVLGAAVHYQKAESGTINVEPEIFRWTLDSSVKFNRFSVLAAVVGNHQDQAPEVDQLGVLGEVGYFLTSSMEAHLRYEWGDSDIDGDDDLSIVTVGLDRHWAKHQVRMIVDLGYAFNSVSTFWANPTPGYRADAPGEDGQIVARTQLELNF